MTQIDTADYVDAMKRIVGDLAHQAALEAAEAAAFAREAYQATEALAEARDDMVKLMARVEAVEAQIRADGDESGPPSP